MKDYYYLIPRYSSRIPSKLKMPNIEIDVDNSLLYLVIPNNPKIPIGGGSGVAQIQSDWAQTDNISLDYIKNKPDIPTNTSELNNDSEFITTSDLGELNIENITVGLGETVEGVIAFDNGVQNNPFGPNPPIGTYVNDGNGIPIKSTDGVGQDATFLVIVDSRNTRVVAGKISDEMPVHNGGRNFEIGDTIVLSGSYLGGVDGTDDMTITVTQILTENIGSVTTIGESFQTNAEAIFDNTVTFNNNNIFNGDITMVTGDDYMSKKITINGMYNTPGTGLTIDNGGITHNINNKTSTISYDAGILMLINNNGTNSAHIILQSNGIDLNTSASTLRILFHKLPIFADNDTAIAGGLAKDTVYKTATGELRIVV